MKAFLRRNCLLLMATIVVSVTLVADAARKEFPHQQNEHCDMPVRKANEVDRRVRILAKPEPNCPIEARQKRLAGEVILSAIFCGSGRVMDIKVRQDLPGLTQEAIEAARKIQFEPAEKDGQKVSQLLFVAYRFNCQ